MARRKNINKLKFETKFCSECGCYEIDLAGRAETRFSAVYTDPNSYTLVTELGFFRTKPEAVKACQDHANARRAAARDTAAE